MGQRVFNFYRIYPAIIHELGLNWCAAAVYGVIEAFENSDKVCFMTNRQIARELGCGIRTVRYAIVALENKRMIFIRNKRRIDRELHCLWVLGLPLEGLINDTEELAIAKLKDMKEFEVRGFKIRGRRLRPTTKMRPSGLGLVVKLPEDDYKTYDYFEMYNVTRKMYEEHKTRRGSFLLYTMVGDIPIKKWIRFKDVVQEIEIID